MTRRVVTATCWIALASYTVILLTLTHLPKPPGIFIGHSDKSLHFLAYFALGLLASIATLVTTRNARRLWILMAALSIFAAIDESTQPVFGRHADWRDYITDLIGLACSIGAVALVRIFLTRKKQQSDFMIT